MKYLFRRNEMKRELLRCRFGKLKCCMRDVDGKCTALDNMSFSDGKCHFRKKIFDGENEYDKWRRKNGKF